jgi:hypothetical protein
MANENIFLFMGENMKRDQEFKEKVLELFKADYKEIRYELFQALDRFNLYTITYGFLFWQSFGQSKRLLQIVGSIYKCLEEYSSYLSGGRIRKSATGLIKEEPIISNFGKLRLCFSIVRIREISVSSCYGIQEYDDEENGFDGQGKFIREMESEFESSKRQLLLDKLKTDEDLIWS